MSTSGEDQGNELLTDAGQPRENSTPSTPLTSTPSWHSMGSALSETLAALGHEFRTPLTIIDGYTSMLLNHGLQLSPRERDEFLQTIQQANKHLEQLIEQLLQIAHLEAGIIQLDLSLVDLFQLARAAITQAKRSISKPLRGRFRFVVKCRDARGKRLKTPALVSGDLHRLRQVVEHLLQNAVKYSPTGGRIDVIIQPASQPGMSHSPGQTDDRAFWELCVCDFGVGIADEHLERIFDPFYRVDISLTREQYGLGVGLAACRHLVSLHHGRIWAESCPDGGSAFHLWLPVAATLAD